MNILLIMFEPFLLMNDSNKIYEKLRVFSQIVCKQKRVKSLTDFLVGQEFVEEGVDTVSRFESMGCKRRLYFFIVVKINVN